MPKGQRIKPEQIVMLLRQVEVLTTNGKTLAQACKEIGIGEQNYYRWHFRTFFDSWISIWKVIKAKS